MDFNPKATFAKSASAQSWTDIASSSLFREAACAAMLQMQANLGLAGNGDTAQAAWFKLEGARAFLSILMNLTTPPEEMPKRMTRDNLNHSV